jgi:glutathione synthase/RimK-type ligase-like ATP-grasp enzyme
MKVGLLLNLDNRLFIHYSEKFREILTLNNVPFRLIDPNSGTLMDDLKECTHLLFRHSQGDTDLQIYESIFNIARNVLHIKCSPDYQTFWQYENKVKEYYLLKSHNLPVVETRVFWNYSHAMDFLETTAYPLVAKLPKGAGSSNVVIIRAAREGIKVIDQVFNKGVMSGSLRSSSNLASVGKMGIYNYMKSTLRNELTRLNVMKRYDEYVEWQIQKDCILFQKFLPDNTFDTRVLTIGKRALAFRRLVRTNDFRASGSGKIDNDPDMIDRRCLKTAMSISKKLNFETMGYDFIYDENKTPFISEISYCFTDSIIHNCPGYWDENMIWHEGHNWPQYYQLVDFLGIPDLKPLDN